MAPEGVSAAPRNGGEDDGHEKRAGADLDEAGGDGRVAPHIGNETADVDAPPVLFYNPLAQMLDALGFDRNPFRLLVQDGPAEEVEDEEEVVDDPMED